jgi:AcrR family transcriptional regulator
MTTVGTKRVPRPEREQQILDVAAAEIGRVGFAGLSMAEVAVRAGVSKPLVYGYFGTKDGLYAACVRRAGDVLALHIGQAIADTEVPPAVMAERTLGAIFTALQPRPNDWNVIFDRTLPAEGEAADAAREVRRRIAGQAASGASAVVAHDNRLDRLDVSAMTEVWMGMVTSLVNWWLRHPRQTPAQMTERCRRLIDAFTDAGVGG